MTPQEFGDLIRTHREAKGLSIDEVVSRLKLSVEAVHGIENGDLNGLPHSVYAKGFVRAYAQTVGVSAEDLAAGLAVLFPEEEEDTSVTPGLVSRNSLRARSQRRSGVFWLFLLVFCVVLGGGGWYAFTYLDSLQDIVSRGMAFWGETQRLVSGEASPEQAPLSTRTEEAPAASSPSPAASVPPALRVTPPAAETTQAPEPVPAAPSDAVQEPVAEPAPVQSGGSVQAEDVSSSSAPEASVESLPVSGNHLTLIAAEECWVQVSTDGGGSRTFTVYPGETSVLPYKSKIMIVLGNAGGVSIIHNGKPYPLNGRRNEKRTITF